MLIAAIRTPALLEEAVDEGELPLLPEPPKLPKPVVVADAEAELPEPELVALEEDDDLFPCVGSWAPQG